MMKGFPAFLAAAGISLLIGGVILVVGFEALTNQNTRPLAQAGGSASGTADAALTVNGTGGTTDALLQQYQEREKQYQAQLAEAQKRIEQANQQIDAANQKLQDESQQVSTYQSLLQALQQRGILRVDPDGQVYIPRRGFDRGGDD
jgi:peptidoglycan hydrolase CwlO-like protein